MKKALSLIISLAICLTLGLTAFAETSTSFIVKNTPTGTTEDLNCVSSDWFIATEDTNNPETGFSLSFTPVYDETNKQTNVKVELASGKSFTKSGKYRFSISEKGGFVQGLTMDTGEIVFEVLVQYANGEYSTLASAVLSGDTKKGSFSNIYETGTLILTQQTNGSTSDPNQAISYKIHFYCDDGATIAQAIRYTLSSDPDAVVSVGDVGSDGFDVAFSLKHGESIQFGNVPYGMNYTITSDGNDGYEMGVGNGKGGKLDSASDSLTLTAASNQSITIGVILESTPYLAMIAFSLVVVFFMILRQRRENREEG